MLAGRRGLRRGQEEQGCFRERTSTLFHVLADPRTGCGGRALVAISTPGAARRGFLQRDRSQGTSRHDGAAAATLLAISLRPGLVPGDFRAARPQAGKAESRISGQGIAIELVLDISGSMEAIDFQLAGRDVSRLEAVKHVIQEFVLGSRERPVGASR